MDKYLRNYKFFIEANNSELDPATQSTIPVGGSAIINVEPPFTIEFDINRHTLSQANEGSFKIYNLAETTRRRLYKDKYSTDLYKGLELKAGYGDSLSAIFKGNVRQAYSVREGINYITYIDAYDTDFAIINGQTNHAFAAGTPQNEMIESLIKQMPKVALGAIGSFSGNLLRGNSVTGNTMERLIELTNNNVFADNEKIYCLNKDECIRGTIPVITSDSGLLGTPKRSEALLEFPMLFEPRLLIGQLLELRSITEKNFNGFYKVIGLKHSGTISDAISGKAVTNISLYFGAKSLSVIN